MGVEHARGRGRSGGADGLSVGILGVLSQAVCCAGNPTGPRPIAGEAAERRDAPDVPDGDVGSLGLLTLVEVEKELRGRHIGGTRHAISFARQQFLADSWVSAPAHLQCWHWR